MYKVLNWLVAEKNDKDLQTMHSDPSRIERFIIFVLRYRNLCRVKSAKDISCLELRQLIDANKEEAGTQGINLNDKFTSPAAKLSRFFNLKSSDVGTPFGVSSLLYWALGLTAEKEPSFTGEMSFLRIPLDISNAVKFIVTHKDELWKIINDAKSSAWNSKINIEQMVSYLQENSTEMGFHFTSEDEWRAIVETLKDKYHLFSTNPVGLVRYF